MDGHEGQAQPSGFYPNGLLPIQAASVTRVLDTERWSQAEKRVAELISCIQPNQHSEHRRNAIESYMKRLITKCFSCQVYAYGSVPLMTYLPDGDIDLTVFSKNQNLKWGDKLKEVIEKEKKREDAEFCVKDVKVIHAKVPIVKCIVENIVVDISFNQLGGLCALCFLEEVDNLINNNHLFKHSIILIKAWCYYESRTLGAQHSLISTYALETLVLYIFHVFNNSFAGPLEVLYRFLEVFSNFDWLNFCVSLWGPVPRSSIAGMAVDPPRRYGGDSSLSKSVYACIAAYTVLPLGQGDPKLSFRHHPFNIIDPLLINNNLGKSVSKGSFFRICSAFSFGAQQLARLLDCPKENLIAEVDHFFQNIWDMHGRGCCPDVPSAEIDGSYSFRNNVSNTSVEVKENSTGSDSLAKCASHAPHCVHSHYGKQYLTEIARSDNSRNAVHVRNPFVWTYSAEVPSGWRHGSESESGYNWTAPNGSYNRRNWGSQGFDNQIARFPNEGRLSSGPSRFYQSNAAANSHGTSNSYWYPRTETGQMHTFLDMNHSRGSHSGIARPPLLMPYPYSPYPRYGNLGYGYFPAEPADQLVFGSLGRVDEASHVDEDSVGVDDH